MRLRLLVPILALLAACESGGGVIVEPPEVLLSADYNTVDRDPGTGIAQVKVRVFNQNRTSVALAGCDGKPRVALERQSATGWENVSAAICPANLISTPVEVGGHAAMDFTVAVAAAGSHRVVATLVVGGEGTSRELRSNPFTVR